jgi:hypothetical protein
MKTGRLTEGRRSGTMPALFRGTEEKYENFKDILSQGQD